MRSQPSLQLIKSERTGFVQTDERKGIDISDSSRSFLKNAAVSLPLHVCSVYKRMILGQLSRSAAAS